MRGRAATISRWVLTIAAAMALALAVLPLAGASGRVGPGEVSVHASWSLGGGSEVNVPPVGRVSFATHAAPLRLSATVESVDASSVQSLVGQARPLVTVQKAAEDGLRDLVRTVALRALLAAVVAGVLVGALVPWRRWRTVLVGGLSGVTVVAVLLGLTWQEFSTTALSSPRYDGALERAPQVINAFERGVQSYQGVQDRIDVLTNRINELTVLNAGPSIDDPDGEVRLLHVSDIHLNPLGITFAGDLARRFDVAAILDTGDLTSFGYPQEANIGAMVSALKLPYYFVPGNHDSFANRTALDGYEGITVVDDAVVDIAGVRVAGFADPNFTVGGHPTYAENIAAREAKASDVAALVAHGRPDILAVAGLQLAEKSAGGVPLVISGDIHRRSSHEVDGSLMLTVGSTGATGLGSFTDVEDRPYEAEVLHMRGGRLVALDYVTMTGFGGDFTLDRTVYTS
jgi:predicted phosphodiesterase